MSAMSHTSGLAHTSAPSLRLVGSSAATPSVPGYVASKARLDKLARRRATRQLANAIYDGRWREALLDCKRSQHLFRETERAGGKVEELLEKVNLVKRAMDMRADIIACEPPLISVDDAFVEQSEAIDGIKRRSLFEARFHEAVLNTAVEGESHLRADITPDGETIVCLEDNDVTYPVGEAGPDGQPQVFERRWIIERKERATTFRASRLYLRVERHHAPGGVGVIEQEAYETNTRDALADLTTLKRVPLADAIPAGKPIPAERVETGANKPTIVQLVSSLRKGEPRAAINEHTLDLIDASAAQLSRLSRTMALHGQPKVRIPESAADPVTGAVNAIKDAVVDPDKQYDYIVVQMLFAEMMTFLDRLMYMLFIELEGSPSLIGLRLDGSGTVTSAAQLRIESTGALSAARRAAPYMNNALERLFDIACAIDARLPMRGYAVAPVSVQIRPDLPLSMIDKAREQSEMITAGIQSVRRAIAAVHGEDQVDAVLAEIDEDESKRTARAAASLAGSFGGGLFSGGDVDANRETETADAEVA